MIPFSFDCNLEILFADRCSSDVVETSILLRERNFGEMEGKPITEYVNAANSAGYKKAYRFVPKGGESAEEVRKRAKCFLEVIDELDIINKLLYYCTTKPIMRIFHYN